LPLSCTAAVSAASHVRQEARSRYEDAGSGERLRAEIEPLVLVECKRLIKDENELQAAGS